MDLMMDRACPKDLVRNIKMRDIGNLAVLKKLRVLQVGCWLTLAW